MRRNREYAESGRIAQPSPMPKTGVLVVTGIDPRVEPAGFLGVEQNDAPVVRNAGDGGLPRTGPGLTWTPFTSARR